MYKVKLDCINDSQIVSRKVRGNLGTRENQRKPNPYDVFVTWI